MSILERKENIQDILISSLWVFIAWLIWSITILVFALILWNQTDIFSGMQNAKFGTKVELLYPIILSFITLFWTVISSILTYKLLSATNPERYKKNSVIFTQVAFLQVLIYLFIAPVYLFFWGDSFENIYLTYMFHILISIFGTNMILDILNNYRYILISVYGNFIWLFISILVAVWIYSIFSSTMAKIFSLIFLLSIINLSIVFIKKIFELSYFHFYRITWSDPIWDIFYKIKKEDEENEKEEMEKNMI